MRYELINKFEVTGASADEIWAVYSSHDLPKHIVQLLPSVFERIDVVEGNGGLGTVLRIVYPPGSIPLTYKEKFVKIDNCKRLKEVLQIEGGYLDMGCTFYMDSFEILPKGCDSCIIKSITTYEIEDELAGNVSNVISVDSLVPMARAISKYVLDKKTRYELVNEFDVDGASADEIWAVYSSHDLPRLIVELLPSVFERIDVVEGNGGLGTVLHVVYPPGSVPLTYKEKFVTVDKCKHLKEVLQIEGGYLDMGVTFYMDSFEIIPNGCDSCIIRSMTKYEINDALVEKVSPLISVEGLVPMARAISKYVLDKKKNDCCSDHGHCHGHNHNHC